MSERNGRGWFTKGHRPTLRPATQIARDLKRGDVTAAVRHGADGHGERGLPGCLAFLAHEHPGAFVGLLSRLLPHQIAGSDVLAAGLVRAASKGKPTMVDMSAIKTGEDAIRAALYARARKGHLAPISRDLNEHGLGVSVASLEAFLSGASLPVPALRQLAKDLFPGAEYDSESGLLRSANRAEPKPGPVAPPAWTPALAAAAYPPAYDPKTARTHQGPLASPATPLPTTPKPKRPGWADK